MSDIESDIRNAIIEAEAGDKDWLIYLPFERRGEVAELQRNRSPMDVYEKGEKICGKRIAPDAFVDEITILPKEVNDISGFQIFKKPPEALVKQILNIESKECFDKLRAVDSSQYFTKVFFDVENKHRRLNRNKIQKYGFAYSGEYDKEPDHLSKVKFGYSVQSYSDIDVAGMEPDISDVERKLALSVKDYVDTVERTGVYRYRKRTIKGAYPVLDIHQTEKIRIGTEYTYYGGMLLKNIDTGRAQKIDMPNYEAPEIKNNE